MIRLRKGNSGGTSRNNSIHRKIYGVLEVTQNMECLSNCKQLILCSVLFDSIAPAHLALRANLRLLFLKGSPAFSVVSSVVNSPGVVSESDFSPPVVEK